MALFSLIWAENSYIVFTVSLNGKSQAWVLIFSILPVFFIEKPSLSKSNNKPKIESAITDQKKL